MLLDVRGEQNIHYIRFSEMVNLSRIACTIEATSVEDQMNRDSDTYARAISWIFGGLLGLSVLVTIDGFNQPPDTLARQIALYCFVAAIPFCAAWLGLAQAQPSTMPRRGSVVGVIDRFTYVMGMLLPVIGFAAWVWHLSIVASLIFVFASILAFIVSWVEL